jgi:hypothetical protein
MFFPKIHLPTLAKAILKTFHYVNRLARSKSQYSVTYFCRLIFSVKWVYWPLKLYLATFDILPFLSINECVLYLDTFYYFSRFLKYKQKLPHSIVRFVCTFLFWCRTSRQRHDVLLIAIFRQYRVNVFNITHFVVYERSTFSMALPCFTIF